MTNKKPEIRFAPGAFNEFDGTQDELNSLMAEIKNMVESGKFLEESKPVDMDALRESDPELYQTLMNQIESINEDTEHKNKLN